MTYAQAMERLEVIMNDVQGGKMDIDRLADVLKEADEIIKFCKDKLYKVDVEVKAVLQNMSDRQRCLLRRAAIRYAFAWKIRAKWQARRWCSSMFIRKTAPSCAPRRN